MKRNTLFVCTILLGSLLSYQNCSMVGSSHNEVSSFGKTCATVIAKTYRDTYYPRLREQCSSCHSDGGRGRIFFASYNFDEAAQNFANTGRPKIEAMLLTAGHQGNPYNGPSQQTLIDRYATTWAKADAEVAACTVTNEVFTMAKNMPTGSPLNADNGDPNTEKWNTLEWDLFSEVKSSALVGRIPVVVNIQYRKLILSGNLEGYEFRKPTGRLKSGAGSAKYTLDGLTIYSNGVQLANATAYETIVADVTSSTAQPLIVGGNSPAPVPKDPNTGLPLMDFANDQISLRFREIRDADGNPIAAQASNQPSLAPARVTYAQLMDPTSSLGVFAKYCVSCHNSTTANGSLNIQSYAKAASEAATIKLRTHSASNPMPAGGLLPQFEQDVVARWVDLGAPQN